MIFDFIKVKNFILKIISKVILGKRICRTHDRRLIKKGKVRKGAKNMERIHRRQNNN